MCVLEDLNATLAYAVQIQCVTSSYCLQCVWSRVYNVSPGEVTLEASRGAISRPFLCVRYRVTLSFSELTVKPVVVDIKETKIGGLSGQRLLTLTWEVRFPRSWCTRESLSCNNMVKSQWKHLKRTVGASRLVFGFDFFK